MGTSFDKRGSFAKLRSEKMERSLYTRDLNRYYSLSSEILPSAAHICMLFELKILSHARPNVFSLTEFNYTRLRFHLGRLRCYDWSSEHFSYHAW